MLIWIFGVSRLSIQIWLLTIWLDWAYTELNYPTRSFRIFHILESMDFGLEYRFEFGLWPLGIMPTRLRVEYTLKRSCKETYVQTDNCLKESWDVSKGFDPDWTIYVVKQIGGGRGSVSPIPNEHNCVHW